MKKIILFCGVLGFAFILTSATCGVTDPPLVDYSCKCTYVPSDTTQAIKEETQTVKAEDNFTAGMECDKLESKYYAQFFSGSCLIQ